MTGGVPLHLPTGAALISEAILRAMDIILHIGAHRTGTTSFQDYVSAHGDTLKKDGTRVWAPPRTRRDLFSGLFPGPSAAKGRDLVRRAEGRVKMHVHRLEQDGVARLLVSEENMIGSSRQCLRARTLYPAIGERMARLNAAFANRISRVVLSIRSQDLWWPSVLAYSVGRGHLVPDDAARAQIAFNSRTWRDVITDVACAVPQAEILVAPFEQFAGRPDQLAAVATGRAGPPENSARWLNRAPDLRCLRNRVAERGENPASLTQQGHDDQSRWQPFTAEHLAALREAYADDMFWLTAGAEGLATLTEDSSRKRAGQDLPGRGMIKGQNDDIEERRLAQSG